MKRNISSIILFPLVIFFITQYRLSWGETPYWLFGIIFLLLFLNITMDLVKENIYWIGKSVIFWLIIICVIGSGFLSVIFVRHQVAPIYTVHDIILQQEAAIRYLLDGKNPYKETYFGTPMEQWHYSDKEVNPALYHFVMEPFYLIFPLPFYVISNILLGYFDARIPLFFLFFGLLIMAWVTVKDKEQKLLFVTLLAFNPVMLPYTLEGRSDIFMFAFFFLGLIGLYTKKYSVAGILLALAFGVKQSAWPFFPFYVAFLYFKLISIKRVIFALVPFVVAFLVIVVPFYMWDTKAFVDSTIGYLNGTVEHSYPISGYGFGMVLKEFGIIKDIQSYYPFVIWQILIGLPVLVVLFKYLKNNLSVKRLILVYGLFLFIYWYFSRYFNNSHMGYLSLVFITAYFFPEDTNG